MMRTTIIIVLSALLGACASPYYPVYVNDNDYYITEKANSETYYASSAAMLGYAGIYPWWEFAYYSPYFYPHYFSVWRPYRYDRWYGWYGGYYPYWYAPYRMPHQRHPVDPGHGMPGGSSQPPLTVANLALLRNMDEISLRREQMNRSTQALYLSQKGSGRSYKRESARASSYTPRYSSKPSGSGFSKSQPAYSSRSSGSRSISRPSRSVSRSSGASRQFHKQ